MDYKHDHDEHPQNLERWLLTYSDMITLLLIFFIVMYTISTVNSKKFYSVAKSLAAVLGSKYVIGQSPGESFTDQIPEMQPELYDVKDKVSKYIEQENLAGEVKLSIDERGLVISFQDNVLFPLGSAEITPKAQEILLKVGSIIKKLPNYIRIEGHTDNLPINNSKFPSNWELSVIRATNVAHFLIDKVNYDPRKISVVGYGEYRPIVPNDSEANRQKNRRVDIVILNTKLNKYEPGNSGSQNPGGQGEQ